MIRKVYTGICRGCPLDGKPLSHYSPTYRVEVPVVIPGQLGFGTKTYTYTYILGQWIGRE